MTASFFVSVLGALSAIASVLLLRLSWRLSKQGTPNGLVRWSAWVAIIVAGAAWAVSSNPDWGIAVALCLFMLAGIAAMGWIAIRQPRRRAFEAGKNRHVTDENGRSDRPWLLGMRRVGIFLLAGPLAGVAALLLTTWIYGATFEGDGGRTANQLFAALFTFPFLWAVLSLIATYDMSLLKRTGVVTASAVLGLMGTYSLL